MNHNEVLPKDAELAFWGKYEDNALVLLGKTWKTFQKISDTMVEAFKAAQPDPTHAAKIKDLAKRLQAIRDRDDTLP